MKRKAIIVIAAVLILSVSGCAISNYIDFPVKPGTSTTSPGDSGSNGTAGSNNTDYMRAVWISQFELSMSSEADKSESAFRNKILLIFQNCKEYSINTVFVQVRPNSDAFYPSDLFPATEYLSGTQGEYVGYDALKIITEEADSFGLSVHAWINPYRVSKSRDINQLSEKNPARIWYNNDNATRNLIICDSGIYYNPAVLDVQRMIIDGVREIVERYDIDGIHLDDYFYPTTDTSIDKADYDAYKAEGGALTLDDWRRENVNSLVSGIYSAVKAIDSTVQFGISCSGDIDKNRNSLYADVSEWSSEGGYVDYLMPQIYFGYENDSKPFLDTANAWAALIGEKDKVSLYCGIAAYKAGKVDENAGSGKNEWCESTDILARQLTDIKSISAYSGYSLFSYSYLLEDNANTVARQELEKIKHIS